MNWSILGALKVLYTNAHGVIDIIVYVLYAYWFMYIILAYWRCHFKCVELLQSESPMWLKILQAASFYEKLRNPKFWVNTQSGSENVGLGICMENGKKIKNTISCHDHISRAVRTFGANTTYHWLDKLMRILNVIPPGPLQAHYPCKKS